MSPGQQQGLGAPRAPRAAQDGLCCTAHPLQAAGARSVLREAGEEWDGRDHGVPAIPTAPRVQGG